MPPASWSQAWEAHSSMLQSIVTDALGTKALDGHSLKLHLLREADRQDEELQGGNAKTPGQHVFFGPSLHMDGVLKMKCHWNDELGIPLDFYLWKKTLGDMACCFVRAWNDKQKHCLTKREGNQPCLTLLCKKGARSRPHYSSCTSVA